MDLLRALSRIYSVRRCLSLCFAAGIIGCGTTTAATSTDPVGRVIGSHEHSFTARLPAGWTLASESLTPHLVNPVEILSAGTFGDMRPREGTCAQMPVGALERIGPDDAFVTVQERFGEPTFPDRPEHFGLPDEVGNGDATACARKGGEFQEYWFGFRDAGRGFHVLVVLGRDAPAQRREEALALLDSIRFEQGPQGVHLDPDMAVHAEDSDARLSWVLVPPWRRYDWPMTSVDGERLAIGTFDLQRSAPDENCTPRAAIDALPPSGAFIYVFEYVDSQDHPVPDFPNRTGELVLGGEQSFECLGESQMVRWRDHGRDFQAHLYFGPRAAEPLKRDALSILNSIQAR